MRLALATALLLLAGACCAWAKAVLSDAELRDVLAEADAMEDWLVGIRRELHRRPETMFEEHETSAVRP